MALLGGRSVWNYRPTTPALSRSNGELQQDFFACHQRRPITESCRPSSTIPERVSDAPIACCSPWEPARGTSESWPIDLPFGAPGIGLHCEEQGSVVHRRPSEQPRLSRPNARHNRAAAGHVEQDKVTRSRRLRVDGVVGGGDPFGTTGQERPHYRDRAASCNKTFLPTTSAG